MFWLKNNIIKKGNLKMIHLRFKPSRPFILIAAILACCILTGFTQTRKEAAEKQKPQKFFLSTTVVEGAFGLAVQEIRGELNWVRRDENDLIFDLEARQINREFEDPNTKAVALKNQPFKARVSVSKEKDVPLSIHITEGKFENNPVALSTQYRTAYLILDMMIATPAKKEFVVSKDGSMTTLKLKCPEKVSMGDFGACDVSRLRSSISPDTFMVFPHLAGTKAWGSDLISFSYGELTVSYFYRLLDKENGISTRAINFEGTMKEPMEKADYQKVFEIIDDPNKFSTYELHVLEVTDIK